MGDGRLIHYISVPPLAPRPLPEVTHVDAGMLWQVGSAFFCSSVFQLVLQRHAYKMSALQANKLFYFCIRGVLPSIFMEWSFHYKYFMQTISVIHVLLLLYNFSIKQWFLKAGSSSKPVLL